MNPETIIDCPKCGVKKSLDQFSKKGNYCKQCVSEYNAKNKGKRAIYLTENKERILKRQTEYNAKNKDKIAKRQAEYYAKNKDKLAEYRAKNRDKIIKQIAKCNAENSAVLSDPILKGIIHRKFSIERIDIPAEMVELYRMQIKLKRLIKQKRNEPNGNKDLLTVQG
jgi:hypothetical protein